MGGGASTDPGPTSRPLGPGQVHARGMFNLPRCTFNLPQGRVDPERGRGDLQWGRAIWRGASSHGREMLCYGINGSTRNR
jgi:hypothetical protein